MPNPYLVAQHKAFKEVRAQILAFQTKATEEKREISDEEMAQIVTLSEKSESIRAQIEELTGDEVRSADVTAMAAKIYGGDGAELLDDDSKSVADQVRAAGDGGPRRPGTTTQDRDPGHYRSTKEGGSNSFFSDLYKAKEDGSDSPAAKRLVEHHRALSTGSHGPGLVAPHWLTEEFESLARQGRDVANSVRHIDLGTDPRPITLPKQTVGTDGVVAEQASENTAIDGTDAYDTDVDVVTPKPTAGKQIVSRQMVDMADPAIDQLIYGDLMSVYNFKVETKVCAALIAAAAVAVTLADEPAFRLGAVDAVVDAETAVWAARFLPPTDIAMTIPRFGKYRKLKDTTGRPIMPFSRYNLQNARGVMESITTAEIEGVEAHGSAGMGTGLAAPDKQIVYRGMDTILFESNVLRFKYEEQAGPESIVLGIWGYTGVIVRQGGRSAKAITMTAITG